MKKYLVKLCRFLASKLFFRIIIGFFIVQAGWIALSADYPQAFDEDFHFGLIQQYSHHWLPFLSNQPVGADPFGAVARDPSYLYHYLMSFPYRFLALFVHSQMMQVISLRILNVALFAIGLVLFRRVLLRLGLSKLAANAGITLISFIPIAPQLAGQINYDNLLLPLTALAYLAMLRVIDDLRLRKLNFPHIAMVIGLCFTAAIVKYEFLPIFLGIGLFLLAYAMVRLRGHWRPALREGAQQWSTVTRYKQISLVVLLAIPIGLFVQRDIGNFVTYHKLVPDCSQVLDIQHCSAYAVWLHDYTSHQAVVQHQLDNDMNPLFYLGEWVYWLWYRLFFAVNGPTHGFQNFPPLPLPIAAFAILLILAVGAFLRYGRRLLKDDPYLVAATVILAVYLAALLVMGYKKYLDTGVLELMNGRYLFPVIFLGVAIGARMVSYMFRNHMNLRGVIVVCALLAFIAGGGGVFTFLSRSDASWDWPNSAVVRANDTARRVTGPVLFDGPRGYSTDVWFFN